MTTIIVIIVIIIIIVNYYYYFPATKITFFLSFPNSSIFDH